MTGNGSGAYPLHRAAFIRQPRTARSDLCPSSKPQATCALVPLVQRNILDPYRIRDQLPVLGLQWESLFSWMMIRFSPVNHGTANGCFLVAQAEADKQL
jgi:hypothetical protein